MGKWKINTKIIESVTVKNITEKYSKRKIDEKQIIAKRQLFENNNHNKISSFELVETQNSNSSSENNFLKFLVFNKSHNRYAQTAFTQLELKVRFSDAQAIDDFNKILETEEKDEFKLKEDEKVNLEKTYSLWEKNAKCLLSLINKFNPEVPFTPKLQQELVLWFHKDSQSQPALDFKKALETNAVWNEPIEEPSNDKLIQSGVLTPLIM